MTDTAKHPRPRRFARTPKPEAPAAETASATPGQSAATPAPVAASPGPGSKIARVLALLARTEGATLDELVAATGWQPHTTRAALTGLRKKGHAIARVKRGDVTCYRIAVEA